MIGLDTAPPWPPGPYAPRPPPRTPRPPRRRAWPPRGVERDEPGLQRDLRDVGGRRGHVAQGVTTPSTPSPTCATASRAWPIAAGSTGAGLDRAVRLHHRLHVGGELADLVHLARCWPPPRPRSRRRAPRRRGPVRRPAWRCCESRRGSRTSGLAGRRAGGRRLWPATEHAVPLEAGGRCPGVRLGGEVSMQTRAGQGNRQIRYEARSPGRAAHQDNRRGFPATDGSTPRRSSCTPSHEPGFSPPCRAAPCRPAGHRDARRTRRQHAEAFPGKVRNGGGRIT